LRTPGIPIRYEMALGTGIDPRYNRAVPIYQWKRIHPFIRHFREVSMFDSLADRIREDQRKEVSSTQRIIQWVAIAFISLAVFGGLYYGVRMMG